MTVNTQELRELLEKATPGPWTWKQVGTHSTPGVALFWPDTSKGGVHFRRLDSNGGMTEADADLITNAVRALPALLDEIDALRAELQARQWISVDERLPDSEEIVLVMSPGSQYQKVNFDCWRMQREAPLGWSSATIETGMGWDEHEFEEITHWMPLPPAPPQGETA